MNPVWTHGRLGFGAMPGMPMGMPGAMMGVMAQARRVSETGALETILMQKTSHA